MYLYGEKNINWKGGPVSKICPYCQKEFFVKPYLKDRAKCCSRICATNWHYKCNPTTKVGFQKGHKRFALDRKGKTFEEIFGNEQAKEIKNKMAIKKIGHIPWNKDTKGVMKPNQTSFKKGHKTWNKGYGDYIKGEKNPNYGKSSWIKGLTKENSVKVREMAEKLKGRRVEWIELTCQICKKKFEVAPHQAKHRKVCSIKCAVQLNTERLMKFSINRKKSKSEIEKLRAARLKQIIPKKDTKIEKIIQNGLKAIGIKFSTHVSLLNLYQVDVLIKPKLVVECDGDYWHNYPEGRESDRIRDKRLRDAGYQVMRFWEHDILKSPEKCFELIETNIN